MSYKLVSRIGGAIASHLPNRTRNGADPCDGRTSMNGPVSTDVWATRRVVMA